MSNERVFKVSLHPSQAQVFNSPARFKVLVAGRRFGKSHFAGEFMKVAGMRDQKTLSDGRILKLTYEHPVYYVAPTQDMAKRIMWPKLRASLGLEQEGGLILNSNSNEGWIELVNSRKLYLKGADNPDSLRGLGPSDVVLDEYADMKPYVWDEILFDSLSDCEGTALFIGTPKGKNHFYKLFQGALMKPTVNPETGLPEDWSDWEAFRFTSDDNPFLSKKEKARMVRGNRSLDVIRQEVNAEFVSGGSKVLRPEWFEVIDDVPGGQPLGNTFITVDLAGFKKEQNGKLTKNDESVVCITYCIEDDWYVLDMRHGKWDVRQAAFQILLAIKENPYCRLGIEQGALREAVLPYLSEYMRKYGKYVHPEELRHKNTKKADRIVWALQGRAQRRKIKLIRGDWNDYFLSQASDFPDPLAHDDGLDALAYVDQMNQGNYSTEEDFDEWNPVDDDLQTY